MTLLVMDDGKVSASLSTVPVWTLYNASAVNTFDTPYTNTTGKTMYLSIHFYGEVTLAGGTAACTLNVDNDIQKRWVAGFVSGQINKAAFGINVTLKPGSIYKLIKTETNGIVTLDRWWEIY